MFRLAGAIIHRFLPRRKDMHHRATLRNEAATAYFHQPDAEIDARTSSRSRGGRSSGLNFAF
jgi:hypothetical protein